MMARLALLAALFLIGCQQSGSLEIQEAWVRPGPPNARMLAAYATLNNGSSTPVDLVEFSSPSFEVVELHRTQVVDGVSRMRQVRKLQLQPGEEAILEPGGLHLMLMRPTGPLDKPVTIHIDTASGERYTGLFSVRRADP